MYGNMDNLNASLEDTKWYNWFKSSITSYFAFERQNKLKYITLSITLLLNRFVFHFDYFDFLSENRTLDIPCSKVHTSSM